MRQHAPARPFYDRVERIRLRNGLSKKEMAEKLGVYRSTVDRWKTNPRSPSARTVKDVAEALDIPHAEALELAGLSVLGPYPDDLGDMGSDEFLRYLWRGPAPEPERRAAIEAVRALRRS